METATAAPFYHAHSRLRLLAAVPVEALATPIGPGTIATRGNLWHPVLQTADR